MKKNILVLTMVLLAAFNSLKAQEQYPPLPLDPAVRMGVLPNGLTYYIRHNEQPKERCEFHIAQAVGATLENDDQNGLAHFLEHMAFNGTEHFPGKLIINYFESVGVSFGGDINAYTSLDETVYRLSNVPTTREGILDSALLVLRDWSCGLSLEGEEIDNERGVIREEWRQGAQAARRMWKESMAQCYPGSKYAIRDVIGDTAVINNFSYDKLRNYYKQWYGPDLQAIVIVGDIDVDKMEQKVKEMFGAIAPRANRGERPIAEVPSNKEPIISFVTDKEAQNNRITLIFKQPAMPKEIQLSNAGYFINICNNLISAMFNERFDAYSQDPNSPMLGAYIGYGNIFPVIDGLRAIVVPKKGSEKAAYETLLKELYRAERYGFTDSELERAITTMSASIDKAYNERNNQRNQALTSEYIRHYLDGTPAPGIEMEKQIFDAIKGQITTQMLKQLFEQEVGEENIIIEFQGTPECANSFYTRDEVAGVMTKVKASDIEAPKEDKIERPLVAKAPKAGKIASEKQNNDLGTTEWTLKNGVKVILKPTKFKDDEISFTALSKGGLSLYSDVNILPSAEMATTVIETSGLGTFNTVELNKVLNGKVVSISPDIDNYFETLNGSSDVKSFETLLQLCYLYFTAPRLDKNACEIALNQYRSALANRDANPRVAFSDSVQLTMSGHSPRTMIVDLNFIDRIDLDKAFQIYKERFSNAADFTFFFTGNINPEDPATKALICQWLGGLKTNKTREEFGTNTVQIAPKGIVTNKFNREMTINAATNRIVYSGDLEYTLKNSIAMRIIGDILGTRYLESIREREGGSYGVGTAGSLSRRPTNTATILMHFDTDPEKEDKLLNIIHEEVNTIVKDGPLAEDFNKSVENLLKVYQENIEKNSYWESVLTQYYLYNINYIKDYVNTLKSIDMKYIQETLKKIVDQNNQTTIIMMPQQ